MGKKQRKIGEGYLSTDRQKSYRQQLDEADPNYKENQKIDNIYDVDSDDPEPEEMSFMDKVEAVWDAYMND